MCNLHSMRSRGFTLVEVLVAAALAGFVLLAVLTTNLALLRSGVRITHYAEMESQARRALEQFGHHVRIANELKWNTSRDITLTVPTASGSLVDVTYAWTPRDDAFIFVPGTDSTATTGRINLLQGLARSADGSPGIAFARFDRDGNPVGSDAATKRIEVSLVLGRQSRTMAATTNAVTATFTMRNKTIE